MANYTMGVDLGKEKDFSALVVTERIEHLTDETNALGGPMPDHDEYHILHAQRLPLKTSYVDAVSIVGELVQTRELMGQTDIVVDRTGVGDGVFDLFREAHRKGRLGRRWPTPVTITGGERTHGFNVPKQDLISKVVALQQQGRLKAAPDIPFRDELIHELESFRAKVRPSGSVGLEAWRERDHDDLVLALALSVWHRHRAGEPRYLNRRGEVVEKGSDQLSVY